MLFVTTAFVGGRWPFYWDRIARAFERTRLRVMSVAGIGTLEWGSERQRARALRAVIGRLTRLPNEERERRVDDVLEALGAGAEAEPASLAMGRNEEREMAGNGIAVGGHTHTHPTLSRLSLNEARTEIASCFERLAAEVPRWVPVLAYTDGVAGHFGAEHERLIAEAGIQAASSLLPGPASWAEVRARPLATRGIAVRRGDHRFRFEARLAGTARLTGDRL